MKINIYLCKYINITICFAEYICMHSLTELFLYNFYVSWESELYFKFIPLLILKNPIKIKQKSIPKQDQFWIKFHEHKIV